MKRPSPDAWASRGFSLVEVMVALLLGLIILAAVAKVFSTSKRTYHFEENSARIQENGRFAMEFMAEDIRMAGYMGCNSALPASEVGNIVNPQWAGNFDPDGIRGYRYACSGGGCTGAPSDWSPALPPEYFPAGEKLPLPGSDVLLIQRGSSLSARLNDNAPTDANLHIVETASLAGQIAADDILMVSNCQHADLFRVTGVSTSSGRKNIAHGVTAAGGTSGNIQPQLFHKYSNEGELMKLITRAYFVAQGASGEPALFRRDVSGRTASVLSTQELVEGIETLKLLYGEDTGTDGVADQYLVPASVSNWRKVVSVRVGFLGRTPQQVADTPDTRLYDVLDDTQTALDDFDPNDDRRRRRVFSSTVRVRNH